MTDDLSGLSVKVPVLACSVDLTIQIGVLAADDEGLSQCLATVTALSPSFLVLHTHLK